MVATERPWSPGKQDMASIALLPSGKEKGQPVGCPSVESRATGLRRGRLLGGLDSALARVLLAKALDATRGVHDLLLAGVEGMALGAHFHVQLVTTERGLRVPPVAATADDGNRPVIGMYLRFHTASVPMVSEKGAHYP